MVNPLNTDLPNFERRLALSESGTIIEIAERIASVTMYDHTGKKIKDLDVLDCDTYREIHFRQFEFIWDEYGKVGWPEDARRGILFKLFADYESTRDDLLDFLKEKHPLQD